MAPSNLGLTSDELKKSFYEMFRASEGRGDNLFKEIYTRSKTINVISADIFPIPSDDNPDLFSVSFFVHLYEEKLRDRFHYLLRRLPPEKFDFEYGIRKEATEIGKRIYSKITEAKRGVQIYPQLLSSGYTPFIEKGLLLEEEIKEFTPHHEMFKDPSEKTELDTTKTYDARSFLLHLEPLVLHHWLLRAHLKNKMEKMPKFKRKDFLDLRSHSEADYITEIYSNMVDLGITSTDLERPLKDLTTNYLTRPNLESTIHDNTTPWNIAPSCLLDASKAKLGSIARDFAHLLGHPDIYNRIKEDERQMVIWSTLSNYLSKAKALREETSVQEYISSLEEINIDVKTLQNAFLFCSAVINFEQAMSLVRENKPDLNDDIETYKATALKQLEELSEKDGAAQEILQRIK